MSQCPNMYQQHECCNYAVDRHITFKLVEMITMGDQSMLDFLSQ